MPSVRFSTDFRQFEQYGNLTGLDMAIMQNSYRYHTRQDIPSKIEKGAIQHMGDNTLALLAYLTTDVADLTNIKKASSTVFFSVLGGHIFVMYSKATALQLYLAMSALAISAVLRNVDSTNRRVYGLALISATFSFLASVMAPNFIAFVMATVLQKPLSWYRRETLPILLFAPSSIGGGLWVQFLFSKYIRKASLLASAQEHVLAHATLCGLIGFYGFLSILGAFFNVGAAYLPALGVGSLLLALVVNDFVFAPFTGRHGHLHLPSYVVGLVSLFEFVSRVGVGHADEDMVSCAVPRLDRTYPSRCGRLASISRHFCPLDWKVRSQVTLRSHHCLARQWRGVQHTIDRTAILSKIQSSGAKTWNPVSYLDQRDPRDCVQSRKLGRL